MAGVGENHRAGGKQIRFGLVWRLLAIDHSVNTHRNNKPD